MEGTQVTSSETIDRLNSFLRGEISAVETYRQALAKIDDPSMRATLEECRASHAQRVDLLRSYIQGLGGTPAQGSGVWGSFAKLVEGGAKVFGAKAAIAALEEGEDHGRDDYQRDLDKVDGPARQFVETQLLAEQHRTHNRLSALQKGLH